MQRTSICPVCSMAVTDDLVSAEHLGNHYYFCSEQCRANFLSRPRLYVGKDAESRGRKEILKHRKFRLARPLTAAQKEQAGRELGLLMGIRQRDVQDQLVTVTYDLWQCRAEQVEACLAAAGAELASGWSNRLRLGWMHYSEKNELDNLDSDEAACCNRPPAKG